MAADNTYPLGGQGIYTKSGSTEMVIGSTSLLTVDGSLQINGLVNYSSNYILTASTANSTLTSYGISIVAGKSTDGGAITHTLAAPRPGIEKIIICTTANNTDTVRIDANNSIFSGFGTQDILVFISPGSATLIGLSTATWGIKAMAPETTGTPAVATTS